MQNSLSSQCLLLLTLITSIKDLRPDLCMCVRLCVADSLSDALKAISVSTELIEEELKPHLDTVLAALLEKSKL